MVQNEQPHNCNEQDAESSRSRRGVVMAILLCPARTDRGSTRPTPRRSPRSRSTPRRKHCEKWYRMSNHTIAMNKTRSRRGVVMPIWICPASTEYDSAAESYDSTKMLQKMGRMRSRGVAGLCCHSEMYARLGRIGTHPLLKKET